ncbi:MAG TPA: hypothetical protein PKW73_10525 [Candidatus Obscuribacter sp.]|nr:hypothetical protein [Candidatus Obscuribacter sp.]
MGVAGKLLRLGRGVGVALSHARDLLKRGGGFFQRRSLLAPPRTRVLGFGDAEALLNIIENTQERRSRELEKRSREREQTALSESTGARSYCPRSTNLDLQALARPGVLKKALQKAFKAAKREMVKLLDKLALA